VRAAALDPRLRFLTLVALWSVALLVILQSPLGARVLVAPLIAWQTLTAIGVSGGSPITIDLSCSGSDVIAVSMAAILAYPVAWRRRLTGLATAAVWLGCLNLLRIMTLVAVAGSSLFLPLHLYVLPGLMIAGAAAFVFHWMRQAEEARTGAAARESERRRSFAVAAGVLLVVYVAVSPWLMQSAVLQGLAVAVANLAAGALRVIGVTAVTGGSTLVVASQPFLITPECLLTPLMPVYLAWASTWPRTSRGRLAATAAFVPMFATLSLLRLMTVALPAMIGPPLFLTHGFYQIVLGVIVVVAAARWRSGEAPRDAIVRRAAVAAAAAVGAAVTLAQPSAWAIDAIRLSLTGIAPHMLSPVASVSDVQGAVAIMPGYQLGLLVGLFVALFEPRRWQLLLVLVSSAAALQVLTLVAVGEAAAHVVIDVPPVALRALAVAGPLLVAALAVARDRRRLRG
jgi:exosortase/archaeosortase family protein